MIDRTAPRGSKTLVRCIQEVSLNNLIAVIPVNDNQGMQLFYYLDYRTQSSCH